MKILSGRDLSKQLEEKYIDEIKHLQAKGINPVLNIIQVGNNQASNVYIANKVKLSKRLNFQCNHIKYDEKISNEELIQNIKKFNNDDSVHGILVQLPLPKHLNESLVIEAIDPNKDVDCFSNTNVGKLWTEKRDISKLLKPCTPFGIITLLKSNHIPISGKNVVIINRSNIVGKPLAALFLLEDATVTVCHSKTQNLKDFTRKADILVSAVGIANYIDESYIKNNAICVDVSINRDVNGKLCGDFNFESVSGKCSYITPVPGGIGPMTIISLLHNLLLVIKNKIK